MTDSSLIEEALWSRTESSVFCLAHLSRLDTWVSANISPALFRAMLWILQPSHLGDREARRYILVSKARHVLSHFLLVLPETGFALKSSTAIHHRRNGWNSFCCSVCWRSSGVIDRTLYARKESSKVDILAAHNPGGGPGDQLAGGWVGPGDQRVGGGGVPVDQLQSESDSVSIFIILVLALM